MDLSRDHLQSLTTQPLYFLNPEFDSAIIGIRLVDGIYKICYDSFNIIKAIRISGPGDDGSYYSAIDVYIINYSTNPNISIIHMDNKLDIDMVKKATLLFEALTL